MIRAQLSRLWRDRWLLLSLIGAFALALLLAKPQGMTLAQLEQQGLAAFHERFGLPELTTMDAALDWYARYVRLPQVLGEPTAILIAAVLASYLIGGDLRGPVITQLYAGCPRWRIALSHCAAVFGVAAVLSLLLATATAVVFGHDCIAQLGADAWPMLWRALCGRLLFDLAAFCPAMLLAFLTREMYLSLCGASILAVMTTMLDLFRAELWWFPPYAAQMVLQYQPTDLWRLVVPSLGMLVVTPLAGIILMQHITPKPESLT